MPAKSDVVEELFFGRRYFNNRELSWLRFNFRVLQEAERDTNPLLERLKFLSIVANNLDEFFEIRVAMLEQKLASNVTTTHSDGLNPRRTLAIIYRLVGNLLRRLYQLWNNDILTSLRREGYAVLKKHEFSEEQREFVEEYFQDRLYPVLTPIKIDSTHPFPWVINKALCIAALLRHEDEDDFQLGVITIPRVLKRIITLPSGSCQRYCFTFVSEIVEANMHHLFKGYEILGVAPFRITRNSNLYLDEEEESNLLMAVEKELANRRKGDVVRLEIRYDAPDLLVQDLQNFFRLRVQQINRVHGPVNFHRVMALYTLIDRADLKYPPFTPRLPEWMDQENIFGRIKEKDRLLHHPYDSFEPVLRMLESAASDPAVHAIKITLYRTGEDSPIIKTLIEAADNGKEVTVVLELRARFDEESNVTWARHLLDNGVHVVYGLLGYKTHCKLLLVVREEKSRLIRYVHIGTGNYNEETARLYTDLSFFTINEEITRDVLEVFTVLTSQSRNPDFRRLLVSPFNMADGFLGAIENEIQAVERGGRGRIIFKVNSLQDDEIIRALYRAARRGVEIIGIVRGICSLRVSLPGAAHNLNIRSIVGRFLEHSRIFYFENGVRGRVFIGSADWMPRNLHRRVETVVPILDPDLERRILDEILDYLLKDNCNARISGVPWRPPDSREVLDGEVFCCQREFMRTISFTGGDDSGQSASRGGQDGE